MDTNKTEMVPIPLPTEVPAPPRLENLPPDILHSATVEMLIQQNEDLSARLKVNIRCNSQLEQKILQLEKESQALIKKHDNLMAQNQIIKEKEKIWSEQKNSSHKNLQSLEQEVALLNSRYNELYTTSQQNLKQEQTLLIEQKRATEKLKKKWHIANQVKKRAKNRLREFLLEVAENFNKVQKEAGQARSTIKLLQQNFASLKNETLQKEQLFTQQLEKLKKSMLENLQTLKDKNHQLVCQIKQLQEKEQSYKNEINEITQKYFAEKKTRIELNAISQELTQLRNEKIKLKRELQTKIERSEEGRLLEVERNQKLKLENKALQEKLWSKQENLKQCEKELLSLSKDNNEVAAQLESTQKLWIEAQEKIETEVIKRKSLEKINRELSQKHKQSQVDKSIANAQAKPAQTTPIKKRLSQVYASQYLPMGKGPSMDV